MRIFEVPFTFNADAVERGKKNAFRITLRSDVTVGVREEHGIPPVLAVTKPEGTVRNYVAMDNALWCGRELETEEGPETDLPGDDARFLGEMIGTSAGPGKVGWTEAGLPYAKLEAGWLSLGYKVTNRDLDAREAATVQALADRAAVIDGRIHARGLGPGWRVETDGSDVVFVDELGLLPPDWAADTFGYDRFDDAVDYARTINPALRIPEHGVTFNILEPDALYDCTEDDRLRVVRGMVMAIVEAKSAAVRLHELEPLAIRSFADLKEWSLTPAEVELDLSEILARYATVSQALRGSGFQMGGLRVDLEFADRRLEWEVRRPAAGPHGPRP